MTANHSPRGATWRTVLLYGAGLAIAAVALEQLKFRHAASDVSTEIYVAMLAVGFTALGLWVGHRLTARKPSASFVHNQAAAAALGLTAREC
ncbi:hypothetical protein [Sphingomonas mesophila]|uniref:hypothetical protein n=1 Tax=Sphingomonas mesophila TaxID=2303576 RepID=UPI0019689C9B|nr:hypothetical protein [Sphingomonas mesophila]